MVKRERVKGPMFDPIDSDTYVQAYRNELHDVLNELELAKKNVRAYEEALREATGRILKLECALDRYKKAYHALIEGEEE